MPVFSHVLVLKAGGVLTASKKSDALTAGLLSKAFDSRVRLQKADGRYTLHVAARRGAMM